MAPGTAAVVFAVLVMVRAGTRTLTAAVQAGAVPPTGQLFPGAAESTVRVRVLPLWVASGGMTVTE